MKMIGEFLHIAEALVNELGQQLNADSKTLFEVEQEILRFINRIGNVLLTEVITQAIEPTRENTILVEGKKAVFKQMYNLRIRNRFGDEIVRRRRTSLKPGDKQTYSKYMKKHYTGSRDLNDPGFPSMLI